MQKPPDPIHTGCGMDRVGPACYNPSKPAPAQKAVAWGKDKRGQKYATDVPGPGSYNPIVVSKGAANGNQRGEMRGLRRREICSSSSH